MDLQLKGKTALVFGGSKGIGKGIADALAAEGVAVAIVARTQETIDRTVSEITARGGRAIGFAGDLANWTSIEAAVKSAREQLGPIDILVNNSGGPPPSGVIGVKPEVWEAQFHAMVMPFFRVTDMLIGEMRARKWGRVLNVASYSVIEPIPDDRNFQHIAQRDRRMGQDARGRGRARWHHGEYAAARRHRDRPLRFAHQATAKRQNISVEEALKRFESAIPVGRMGTPAEFGAVAAFLASPLAAYVTGSMIRIDGGLTRSV